jgi:hypothetical protein
MESLQYVNGILLLEHGGEGGRIGFAFISLLVGIIVIAISLNEIIDDLGK